MQAADWNARYAEKAQWSDGPNELIASLLTDLPPGRAVDLAAGEGRHARWLAGLGWEVTAVDFAAVGLDRGRSAPGGDAVRWVVADVLTWTPDEPDLDLVLVAYLHLAERETVDLLTRAVGWLRPGGRLLVLGHDVENLTAGTGGPQDPAILHSVGRLAPVAALLEVEQLAQVPRPAPRWTPCCSAAGRAERRAARPGLGTAPSRYGDLRHWSKGEVAGDRVPRRAGTRPAPPRTAARRNRP